MEREKPTFDILGRIEHERLTRGWSEYALAENSGLTQSKSSAECCFYRENLCRLRHHAFSVLSGGGLCLLNPRSKGNS